MARILFVFACCFASLAFAERLTPVDQIESAMPNSCSAGGCSPMMQQIYDDYLEAPGVASFGKLTAYTGLCGFSASSMRPEAYGLYILKRDETGELYHSGWFLKPTRNQDGTLRDNPFLDISESEVESRAQVGDDSDSVFVREDFAFTDSRRTDNQVQFISWMRTNDDGSVLYTHGYFSLSAIFHCEMERLNL